MSKGLVAVLVNLLVFLSALFFALVLKNPHLARSVLLLIAIGLSALFDRKIGILIAIFNTILMTEAMILYFQVVKHKTSMPLPGWIAV